MSPGEDPIAIIGFAFEFPQQASSTDAFWRMISEGRSAHTDIPKDRMNVDAFYHPDAGRHGTIHVRGGSFIQGNLDAFDAPFFSITPGEASCMDPQHRHMLETTYRALENAGISISSCSGSDASVYTGCFTNDYLNLLQQDYEAEQSHAAMGIAPSMLANRVSWFFDFKGTSMNIDSACSSSLVALHLACQDLKAGTTSMALAGGANLIYHPNFMKIMSAFNFLSPDSRCWSFDDRANGYARGEGIVMMVLKRLSDALHDGNTIRAVIRNTGSNQDGRTPGITQPNLQSQVNLVQRTYQQANIDMRPTRFFEAHGTGTVIGDCTEAKAIAQTFGSCRTIHDPLYIGAVKANIGHLEGASGLAGIVKTILVLENGVIPPIAGFETLNSRLDPSMPLHFPTRAIPWPTAGLRRACVNSFGFGGTNTTAILDDACHYLQIHGLEGHHYTRKFPPARSSALNSVPSGPCNQTNFVDGTNEHSFAEKPTLLVWSAADKQAAQALSAAYKEYVARTPYALSDLAYSLVTRRSQFSWRSFMVVDPARSMPESGQFTRGPAPSWSDPGVIKAREDPGLAFIFTGQGAQYVGMGRELFSFPVFRHAVDLMDECLKLLHPPGYSWSLRGILQAEDSGPDQCHEIDIDNPQYSQTLTTCLQIALVDLLESLGIMPSFVIGHSSGEIAAAYATGALSLASAIKVSYYRGLLSAQLADRTGNLSMMAVGISRHDIVSYLDRLGKAVGGKMHEQVSIGCVNSPQSVTLTGSVQHLDILQQWLDKDGIFARRLRVQIAYHSSVMCEIVDEYRAAMGELHSGERYTAVSMISSVTQDIVINKTVRSPDYWVRNLVSTVEFEGALTRLVRSQRDKRPQNCLGSNLNEHRGNSNLQAVTHCLEIGPHRTLEGPVNEILRALASETTPEPIYVPLLTRHHNSHSCLLATLGKLYSAGYTLDILSANDIPETPTRPMPRDMPAYPFNHEKSYWREGRLSQNFRFRSKPRHDLLGSRSTDWNPQVAQWHNILRVVEVPWVMDHRIDGQIVLPATGMVIMAVEALREVLNDVDGDITAHLTAVQVKEVSFLHAIRFVQDADEVETQVTLATVSKPGLSVWSQFRIFVVENTSYIECCRGLVRGISSQASMRTFCMSESAIENLISSLAGNEVKDPYTMSTGSSVEYGPCFQNVREMRLGKNGEAVATIRTDAWRPSSNCLPTEYMVHPCTMDGLAQLLVPALAEAGSNKALPTMVPVRASNIWIDCSNLACLQNGELLAAANCRIRNRRGAGADIVGIVNGSHRPVLCIEGLETTFIGSVGEYQGGETRGPRPLCTKLIWKPDIDLLSRQQIYDEMTHNRPHEAEDAMRQLELLQLVILCFIDDALEYIHDHQSLFATMPEYLLPYVDWMKHQKALHQRVSHAAVQQLRSDRASLNRLIADLETYAVDKQFFMHVGRHLLAVLRGEVDPLALVFDDGLADRYYDLMLGNPYHSHPVSAYIDQLSFKNPSMKIMEIGAGTGGQTSRILETLASDEVMKCLRYDYTDISPSFFPRAKERFEQYADVLCFRVCDISLDPASQGFECGSYDLIIASHVLHATKDLDIALANIQRLLKPGGRLLLFETIDPDALHVGFAFGLLKGWWAYLDHEDRSRYSPCLTTAQWETRLKNTGFSGVDVEVPGQEKAQAWVSSIIVSTALADKTPINGVVSDDDDNKFKTEVVLVRCPESEFQCRIADLIACGLPGVSAFSLAELADADDLGPSVTVVFLLELRAVFLAGISEADYLRLQSVLLRPGWSVLWASQQVLGELAPQQHLADGLGRTLASEDSTKKIVTLTLDSAEPESKVVTWIVRLVGLIQSSPIDSLETHYLVEAGIVRIPRVTKDIVMNETVYNTLQPCSREQCRLPLDFPASLQLDPFGFHEEDPTDPDTLRPDELVVQVEAFDLSSPDTPDLALQCAGIVEKAGSSAEFVPGDMVCLIGIGLARNTVLTQCRNAALIPPGMTFLEAASLPTSLWVAYHALYQVARLGRNESVLVHNASSSIAQVVVQLAKNKEARVLATVRTDAETDIVSHAFGLSSDDIFCTDDEFLAHSVLHATDGKGVNVVIAFADDDEDTPLYECLASFGRIININMEPTTRPNTLFMPMSSSARVGGITRTSLSILDILQRAPDLAQQAFHAGMALYSSRSLTISQPSRVYPATELPAAVSNLSSDSRVVELTEGITVEVERKARPSYTFPSDASYVIAGGLGGLGRLFARWMVQRGARYLILLSRSGPQSTAAQELIADLESQGVFVSTPLVDIGNLATLQKTLDELGSVMPPIRGCIQAAVALRDNLFPVMSYTDWSISTSSKVSGSWNLHQLLPLNLDFFILISSLNGIFGSRAQANYAAGNTFKDALARYRLARGQNAISIDLGLMAQEGVVAENEFLLASMRRIGHLMDISIAELLALLEHYCDPRLQSRSLCDSPGQVLVGIEMPAEVLRKGISLHHSIRRPIFSHLFRTNAHSSQANTPGSTPATAAVVDCPKMLAAAASGDDAAALVTDWACSKVGQILGRAAADIEPSKPIHVYGIDSLVAVDVRNWFEREVGAHVTVFDLMGNVPLRELCILAVRSSRYRAA
ncbi:putative polyketide synthase [Aspergillus venezuelensis]